MAFAQSTVVNVFDKYHLLLSPKLKSYQDGPPGRKVTFITDPKETFVISFEEGMPCMDLANIARQYTRQLYRFRVSKQRSVYPSTKD